MYICICIVELCFSLLNVLLVIRYFYYNIVYLSVVIIFYYVFRVIVWEYV